MPSHREGLYDVLSRLRLQLAQEASQPAFTVFSNQTLTHMVKLLPRTKEAFLEVHGIGPAKWEKYGQLFLETIIQYCAEHEITQADQTHPLDGKTLEEIRATIEELFKSLTHLSYKLGIDPNHFHRGK